MCAGRQRHGNERDGRGQRHRRLAGLYRGGSFSDVGRFKPSRGQHDFQFSAPASALPPHDSVTDVVDAGRKRVMATSPRRTGRGQDAVVTGLIEIREGAVWRSEGVPHQPIVAMQRRDVDRVPLRSDQLRRALRAYPRDADGRQRTPDLSLHPRGETGEDRDRDAVTQLDDTQVTISSYSSARSVLVVLFSCLRACNGSVTRPCPSPS